MFCRTAVVQMGAPVVFSQVAPSAWLCVLYLIDFIYGAFSVAFIWPYHLLPNLTDVMKDFRLHLYFFPDVRNKE